MGNPPPPQRNPFEVRTVVYGGILGHVLDTHPSLEQAEAAHREGDPDLALVVLCPSPADEQGQKVVCSERDSSGRWKRAAFPWLSTNSQDPPAARGQ